MSRLWSWLERFADRQREDLLDRVSEQEREGPPKALQRLQAMASRSSEGEDGIGSRLLLAYEEDKAKEKLQAKRDMARKTDAAETGQRNRFVGHEDYRPKCPTCGSTNVEKIPTNWESPDPSIVKGEAIRTLLFGRRKNAKQFRCRNCTYEW